MEKTNTTDIKFWAGGAREFHNAEKKNKSKSGFFAFLNRFFPLIKPGQIDPRLFLKKGKAKKGKNIKG
jgi:hypothetical protein